MDKLAQPIAVVCHDAGAANILLATMQANSSCSFLPVMQGPAERLWRDAGLPSAALLPLTEALAVARTVVSGTGWASSLEHEARHHARALGLHSVALIDHWVDYGGRFERTGVRIMPDELWITDDYAHNMALLCFPDIPIRQIPNLYLQRLKNTIKPLDAEGVGNLLYVLEPIRHALPAAIQAGEFEALDYLVQNIDKLRDLSIASIYLRPHPSDKPGKYDEWLTRNSGIQVTLDTELTLADAISRAEYVAGWETMALAVALEVGRRTICTIPPGAPSCRLPHRGMIHLREL